VEEGYGVASLRVGLVEASNFGSLAVLRDELRWSGVSLREVL
jgi:hypothetical protein